MDEHRRRLLQAGRYCCQTLGMFAFFSVAVSTQVFSAPATFNKGSVSIGIGGGLALISMDDVTNQNNIRDQAFQTQWEEFGTAPEVTADIRYAIVNKFFLGLEGGYFRATIHEPTGNDPLGATSSEASCVPLVFIAGWSTTPDGNVVFRVLGGLGALINGKLVDDRGKSLSGTGAIAQVGGEVEWRAFSQGALAVEGLVRSAKVVEPEGALFDLDFSGGSLRLMLRGYFGGKSP